MDGGDWKAAVHGVAEGRTLLKDFTFTFHFHALKKEMATHSSVLAWRIPGTGSLVGYCHGVAQSRTRLKRLSSSSSSSPRRIKWRTNGWAAIPGSGTPTRSPCLPSCLASAQPCPIPTAPTASTAFVSCAFYPWNGYKMEVLIISSKVLEIFLSLKRQHISEYSWEYPCESLSSYDIIESATDSWFKFM